MTVLAAAAVDHTDNSTQLVIAALLGIAAVVVLIVWLKVHPFLSLILGSAVLGAVAGVAPTDIITSFTTGLGATTGSVGLLIALGAMIGGLLTASGGADRIVTSIVDRVGPRALPWAMGGGPAGRAPARRRGRPRGAAVGGGGGRRPHRPPVFLRDRRRPPPPDRAARAPPRQPAGAAGRDPGAGRALGAARVRPAAPGAAG